MDGNYNNIIRNHFLKFSNLFRADIMGLERINGEEFEEEKLEKEKMENHELLSITISLDHDIVDGAPAARLISRFAELVENAYGLI